MIKVTHILNIYNELFKLLVMSHYPIFNNNNIKRMCSVHINNSLLDNVPSIYLQFHYPRYFSLISHSSWVADINIIASRNFLLAAFGDIFDLKHNSMVIVQYWKWLEAIEGFGGLLKAMEGYWRILKAMEGY